MFEYWLKLKFFLNISLKFNTFLNIGSIFKNFLNIARYVNCDTYQKSNLILTEMWPIFMQSKHIKFKCYDWLKTGHIRTTFGLLFWQVPQGSQFAVHVVQNWKICWILVKSGKIFLMVQNLNIFFEYWFKIKELFEY